MGQQEKELAQLLPVKVSRMGSGLMIWIPSQVAKRFHVVEGQEFKLSAYTVINFLADGPLELTRIEIIGEWPKYSNDENETKK